MELSRPIGARSDNWAEVDVTATAADYDGESSVKTCFSVSVLRPPPSRKPMLQLNLAAETVSWWST